jgi:anti-anti-sigma factor
MKLKLTIHKDGDITLIEFSGRFEIGESVEFFRDTVRQQVKDGALQFVWNLQMLEYCDSYALGALVSEYTAVRTKGGDVKLVR